MLMRFVAMALGGTRMSDLISRQAAIELIHTLYPSAPFIRMNRKRWEEKYKPYIECEKALERLPSAQPEIIRCKDCKHYEPHVSCAGGEYSGCDYWPNDGNESPCEPTDFCSYAERETDG